MIKVSVPSMASSVIDRAIQVHTHIHTDIQRETDRETDLCCLEQSCTILDATRDDGLWTQNLETRD